MTIITPSICVCALHGWTTFGLDDVSVQFDTHKGVDIGEYVQPHYSSIQSIRFLVPFFAFCPSHS